MKKNILRTVFLLSVSSSVVFAAIHMNSANAASVGGSTCAISFASDPAQSQDTQWRQGKTLLSPSGELALTSVVREAEIKKILTAMANETQGIGMPVETPPIEFIAQEGVDMKFISHTDGTTHIPTRIVLSKVGASGIVKGTLLAPVSGHTGAPNALKWSKTDTFTLTTDESIDKDGKKWNNDSEKTLIKDSKSLDLVTAQEIEVQLSKDHMTRVLYYRSGSGGPAGYWDGRVIELVWDGT